MSMLHKRSEVNEMNDLRFEASYYEGDPDERSPEWNVIE